MSDVLIKGMEMPKDTGSITVTIYSDGSTGIWTEQEMISGGMAIELPEHGDLKDETDIIHRIEKIADADLAQDIIGEILASPTIVEASR